MVAPEDAEDLSRMLASAGGRVLHASRTFADEIEIVVGPPHTDPLFDGGEDAAVWRIGTQASDWTLDGDPDTPTVDVHADTALIDAALVRLVGANVQHLEPRLPDLGLVLTFEDGRRFTVVGAPATSGRSDELEFPEPPFWEVFTPDNHVIAAGPGLYWSRVPANVPEREIADPLSRWRERDFATNVVLVSMRLTAAVVATVFLAVGAVGADILTLASRDRPHVGVEEIFAIVLSALLVPVAGFLAISYRHLRVPVRSERLGLRSERQSRRFTS